MSDKIDGIEINVHKKSSSDRFLVISLDGRMDVYNGEAVMIRIKELFDRGYSNILLDCEGLLSIDDMGAGVFFSLRELIGSDGEFKLEGLSGQPEELLKELGYIEVRTEFPKIMSCPGCNRRVKAYAPGRYRCPFCRRPVVVRA